MKININKDLNGIQCNEVIRSIQYNLRQRKTEGEIDLYPTEKFPIKKVKYKIIIEKIDSEWYIKSLLALFYLIKL